MLVLRAMFLWSLLCPLLCSVSGYAEEESPPSDTQEEAGAKADSGAIRLRNKLTKEDGTISKIGLVAPIDYTTMNFGDTALNAITTAIARYGDIPTESIDTNFPAITLEDFRKVILQNKLDVAIVMILKPTNFDMFLFDKRTPYAIYAHSEVLPEEVQFHLSAAVVEEYSRVILRRIFYSYLQGQSYELPRQETTPILSAEIPRWIASVQSFNTVNREILSTFYGSASVGAALSMGEGRMWNSNLVGLEVGMRLFSNVYAEGSVELFAYNALGVSLKYIANNLDSPFRYGYGLGLAAANNNKTINWDQEYTQGIGGTYVVPSAMVLFPIVDMHFKIEGKAFVGIDGSKMVLMLMPGFTFFF